MKCHCPACGRTTEIDPISLDFFGQLASAAAAPAQGALQEEEGAAAVAVRVINPGRVRESQSSTGQIADLPLPPPPPPKNPPPQCPRPSPSASPSPFRKPIPPHRRYKRRDKDLYTLAPPTVIRPITTVADIHVAKALLCSCRRRFLYVNVSRCSAWSPSSGIGMSAAHRRQRPSPSNPATSSLQIRPQPCTNDTVQHAATPPSAPAQTPSATPQAHPTAAGHSSPHSPTPEFTVGDALPTANPRHATTTPPLESVYTTNPRCSVSSPARPLPIVTTASPGRNRAFVAGRNPIPDFVAKTPSATAVAARKSRTPTHNNWCEQHFRPSSGRHLHQDQAQPAQRLPIQGPLRHLPRRRFPSGSKNSQATTCVHENETPAFPKSWIPQSPNVLAPPTATVPHPAPLRRGPRDQRRSHEAGDQQCKCRAFHPPTPHVRAVSGGYRRDRSYLFQHVADQSPGSDGFICARSLFPLVVSGCAQYSPCAPFLLFASLPPDDRVAGDKGGEE